MVVNMSLGGPLRNSAMFRALQYMQDRVLVVTSGGNGFAAPGHYPASFSSRLPNPGLLSNVISVAASGYNSAGVWGAAGFNTRSNASLFAPGINLCPASMLTFRCKNSLPYSLDDLGATGSSFAAPVVAAIAALYLDNALPQQSLTPLRLGQCLVNHSRTNPLLDRMVYFDSAGC
jgi:subtilisin family serine protease